MGMRLGICDGQFYVLRDIHARRRALIEVVQNHNLGNREANPASLSPCNKITIPDKSVGTG
jgi:hypothetical protein